MKKYFIKNIESNQEKKLDEYSELLNSIDMVKKNLQKTYSNMKYVKDEKLLDYYTYKIKSEESQYDFLVQEAKKMNS